MVGHENARVIDVEHGMLTVTGEGSIMAMGLGGVAISIRGSINQSTANYAKVIIDQQVRLHAPNSYGIVIGQGASAAYGVAVELRGSISAQDGIYINGNVQGAGDNAPEIQLADHSVVNVEDTGIVAAGLPTGVAAPAQSLAPPASKLILATFPSRIPKFMLVGKI